MRPANPPDRLRSGVATVSGVTFRILPRVQWGTARDLTFRVFQQSLKWLEPLILRGRSADLALARSLVHRWSVDNAGSTPAVPRGVVWTGYAVALRASTLACLRLATGGYPELDLLLRRHIVELTAHYEGAWNHGFAQDAGLAAAGCVLGDRHAIDLAHERAAAGIRVAIDRQGATNEQAPGYALHVLSLLTRVKAALADCAPGRLSPSFARLPLVPTFRAHATQPDGLVVPLGDSSGSAGSPIAGTALEYPLSLGRRGTPPAARVAVYDAGYVLARSGWGSRSRPFTAQDYWTLRFGPPRAIHGHFDHTSITLFARGRPLIVDSGFKDYVDLPFREFGRAPRAHNMTVVAGAAYRNGTTRVAARRVTAKDETFAVADRPYAGVQRRRTVFAAHDVPVTVVVDRTTADRTRTFTQLWHVHPDLKPRAVTQRATQFRAGTTSLHIVAVTWPGRGRASVAVTSGQRRPLQGWLLEHGTARPAPVVGFTSRGRQQLQVALIVPTRPGVRLRWSIAPAAGGRARLTVTAGASRVVLLIDSRTGWAWRA